MYMENDLQVLRTCQGLKEHKDENFSEEPNIISNFENSKSLRGEGGEK